MVLVKVKDLDDMVQDWVISFWGYKHLDDLVLNELVDRELVFEAMKNNDPSLFKKLTYYEKYPEEYKVSRSELLDI